ncbi:MAG: LysM peptidoglycan-binding domain-containing M23 family metallopeptidase [Candidatus Paceibacterota bacterium]
MSSGGFLVPLQVSASFLSTIMGMEAAASTDKTYIVEITENAQTMALLQANMTILPIAQKQGKDKEEIDQSKSVSIMSEIALVPSVSPQSITSGTGEGDLPLLDQMSVYVVRKGDSLAQIAEMFDVSTNTILWANDLKKGTKLSEGDVLLILPVSGIKHIVAKGQTIASIAKLYKVDTETIIGFNGLSDGSKLSLGDELIIPDGQMPTAPAPSKPKSKGSIPKYAGNSSVNANGYYINPVPELKRRSQGLHGNNSVDLAAATGTRILASASGRVLLARTGYNGGYGNMVIIEHPNGTKTLYAHMTRLGTSSGAQVSQGEVIGYVGSTGRSTGPHLHFEVHGARNPGSDWSWKN